MIYNKLHIVGYDFGYTVLTNLVSRLTVEEKKNTKNAAIETSITCKHITEPNSAPDYMCITSMQFREVRTCQTAEFGSENPVNMFFIVM